MSNMVKNFQELTPEFLPLAGGKGGMLARMYQDGYPVPDGIVIMPSAFREDQLDEEVWPDSKAYLRILRKNEEPLFAVRSSALSEDSAHASFAGEFTSVLDVKTDEEILAAINTVYKSRLSDRVKVYSHAHGMEQVHEMAVVVQKMVQSEISGVLFTADPITGSRISMVGNFIYGLGEQLVSGEVDAYSFKLIRPTGKYDGSAELKKHAAELFKYATRLETAYGSPQDIEWAVAKGKLYILQSRPVTTLSPGNPDTYAWNDSLAGDFLWVNTNIGEAMPEVLTPLTWTLARALDNEINIVPGYYTLSGNICGRAYTNVNMSLSILSTFGVSIERGLKMITAAFGRVAVKHIPARMRTYNKYRSLPPFPSIIRGRFDSFAWAEDSNRRVDCYDYTRPVTIPDSETLNGFAGAAGRIEGKVRVLKNPEDGVQLQPGEILVTSTTNVGWPPLFLKAAAVITDIGAPASHAAIVARELGIPAVVGCGNATARLKTGDRVIVDGGQGAVQILT